MNTVKAHSDNLGSTSLSISSYEARYNRDVVMDAIYDYLRTTEYRLASRGYTIPDSISESIDDELAQIYSRTGTSKIRSEVLRKLGSKIGKRYQLKKDVWRYGGTIAMTLLAGLGMKSCTEHQRAKSIEVQKILASKQVECDRILQVSCQGAYDGLYMQLRPLVKGADIQNGTPMNVLYIYKTADGVCSAIDNQVHITETYSYKSGKNTRTATRDVGVKTILPNVIPYDMSMQTCVTDWKG